MNRLLDRREFGSSAKKLLAGLLAAGAVDLTAPKKAQANQRWNMHRDWADWGWSENHFEWKTYNWHYTVDSPKQYFHFDLPRLRDYRWNVWDPCWGKFTPGWQCKNGYEMTFRYYYPRYSDVTRIICPCGGIWQYDGVVPVRHFV